MARQNSTCFEGRFGNLVFYRFRGRYYVRRASSLSGKTFWNDKAFAGSRTSARLLSQAARLSSELYATLPKEKKGRSIFHRLTGKIKIQLQEGKSPKAISEWFAQEYMGIQPKASPPAHVIEASPMPSMMGLYITRNKKNMNLPQSVIVVPSPIGNSPPDRRKKLSLWQSIKEF